jgi:hypothetical protein
VGRSSSASPAWFGLIEVDGGREGRTRVGHAVIGGAVATLLKAWFADGDWATLTGLPLQESRDGVILTPIPGASTVHKELDKLAWCYGQGRVFGGIHFRSDCTAGLALGEEVALRWLSQHQGRQRERLGAVSFWKFDGTGVIA